MQCHLIWAAFQQCSLQQRQPHVRQLVFLTNALAGMSDARIPPTFGDERKLRSKAFHMVGLLLQEGQRNQLGEVGVLVASVLEGLVQVALDSLPKCKPA